MAKTGGIAAERLRSFIERIEKLEEERKAIGSDIKDVYSEAKGVGYDVKTMRKIVSLRKMDAADRDEQEALLDTYKHALGMVIGGTELNAATVAREPSENELVERAGRIIGEVDRCMTLVDRHAPPKIDAIRALIGCSAGKAHKLRGMVEDRLDQFSRISARERENENVDPDTDEIIETRSPAIATSDSTEPVEPTGPSPAPAAVINPGSTTESCGRPEERTQAACLSGPQEESASTRPNGIPTPTAGVAPGPRDTIPAADPLEVDLGIHRGAMQPKGCAKVMRTEPSMSGSVAASGDAVRDASAMPLDVVVAPHSEGREHAGSAAAAPPACSGDVDWDRDVGPIPAHLRGSSKLVSA